MKETELIRSQAHIGIPTEDMERSRAFYESLGFRLSESARQTNGRPVIFMEQAGTVLEIYEHEAVKCAGAIDHIAFETEDIEDAYARILELGYETAEGRIMFMDLGPRQLKYFTVKGPFGEKIEFCSNV